MNKYLFLLFLFLGGGLVSCMQTHTNVDLLERAERYVEVYPDSAMQLLNLIQYPEGFMTKKVLTMLYCGHRCWIKTIWIACNQIL